MHTSLVALLLSAIPAVAQADSSSFQAPPSAGDSQSHRVVYTRISPNIDGRVTEAVWERAAPVSVRWEWKPGDNVPAPVQTGCRFLYDQSALYIGCVATDPNPERIRAHLADRDVPVFDDHISFLLDTHGDQRRAYHFAVNPLGVQMDALYSGDLESGYTWDAIWHSKGRVTDTGFEIEVAIPWGSISFPSPDSSHSWGLIVGRYWPRTVGHELRSIPTDRDQACLLCQAAALEGFEHDRLARRLELVPTLVADRVDRKGHANAEGLATGDWTVAPALNARWRATSNLTATAAVNPDFSQVEADAAQLEVNRRFALFFPEKRPFFQVAQDLFESPEQLIFTRSVIEPDAGLKLTGKMGAHAVAAFVTRDRVNGITLPGPEGSERVIIDRETYGTVGRYRLDVGRSSRLGLAITNREAVGYQNRMLAADGLLRVGDAGVLSVQAAGSLTSYPDSITHTFSQPTGEFSDHLLFVQYQYDGRDWLGTAEVRSRGKDFRADAGFLPQVDMHGGLLAIRRQFWGSGEQLLSRADVGVSGERFETSSGQVVQQEFEVSSNFEGPLQSSLHAEVSWQRQLLEGRTFDTRQEEVSFSLRPLKDFGGNMLLVIGEALDTENARTADLFRIRPEIEARLGRHLAVSVRHTLENLRASSTRIFRADLSELRMRYHFNRQLFLRGILQYRNLSRTPEMFREPVPPESDELFGQVLISWRLNPKSAAFAGYSTTREARSGGPLDPHMRTFFVKLSFAWRP